MNTNYQLYIFDFDNTIISCDCTHKGYYNIEGLAGYNLDFDGSDDYLQLGTGSDNCFQILSYGHVLHAGDPL